MNIIDKVFLFNLYLSFSDFSITQNIRSIFLTKNNKCSNLLFLLAKTSEEIDSEMVLTIVRDYSEIFINKHINEVYANLGYDIIYEIMPNIDNDIVCCLFAWQSQYPHYEYINFFNCGEMTFCPSKQDKLRATLNQLLVNRIVPETRLIRYLFDEKNEYIKIIFIHYTSDFQRQYLLIEELLKILSSTILFSYKIEHIQFDGNFLDIDIKYHIQRGELVLFTQANPA